MGLDHELRRKAILRNELERVVKALDFGDKQDEMETLLSWRKDYALNDYIGDMVKIDNAEEVELTKDDLIEIATYLNEMNGTEDKHWKGEILDYDIEIKTLKEIIDTYDDGDYKYYYWAWW